MEWVKVETRLPKNEGKFVVKTRTTHGNIHKLECFYHIHDGKGKFGVSNQVVIEWLDETNS